MNLRASKPRLWGSKWQITRIRWERGKLIWEPRDLWVGLYWTKPESNDWLFYICLLPCLPIRLHFIKAFGGRFP